MTSNDGLAARFEHARGRALVRRHRAKQVMRGGLALLGASALLWWPDPAGNESFSTYAEVPSALAAIWRNQGVAVESMPWGVLTVGLYGRWFLAIAFPLALIGHAILRRLIPHATIRRTVIMIGLPFTIPLGLSLFPHAEHFPAVRAGVIADRTGMPMVAVDGTGQHFRKPYVPDFARLDQVARDQAHFVLAQMAYLDGAPARVRDHLAALTGHWHPDATRHLLRLGVLDGYVRAHHLDPGPLPRRLSAGRPHAWLKRLLWDALVVLDLAALMAAITVDCLALRAETRLRALLARLHRHDASSLAA